MYLSSVPPSSITMRVISVRYSRSICTTSCGSFFSVKVVKSRMSEKSTVRLRSSPPNCSASGLSTIRATTSGLTYCWNAALGVLPLPLLGEDGGRW